MLNGSVVRSVCLRLSSGWSWSISAHTTLQKGEKLNVVARNEWYQSTDASSHRNIDEAFGSTGDEGGTGHPSDNLADVVVTKHIQLGRRIFSRRIPEGAGARNVYRASVSTLRKTKHGNIAKFISNGDGIEIEKFLTCNGARVAIVGYQNKTIGGGVVSNELHRLHHVADESPVAGSLKSLDHCWQSSQLTLP